MGKKELLDGLDLKNNDKQKSHFNKGTEEATNMEANRGTSAVNISTITSTSNSNKQIIVSPRSTFNCTPRRQKLQDKGARNITAK